MSLPSWVKVKILPTRASITVTANDRLTNVVSMLFLGDRLCPDQFPPLLCAYQQEDYLFSLLERKFPLSTTLVLVHPEHYTEQGFGCYSQFIDKLSKFGNPLGYQPNGRKATQCLQKLVQDVLRLSRPPPCSPSDHSVDLVGFSRGGLVLNQVLAEMCFPVVATTPAVPQFPTTSPPPTTTAAAVVIAAPPYEQPREVDDDGGGGESPTKQQQQQQQQQISFLPSSSSPTFFTEWNPESREDLASDWALRHISALHYVDAGANGVGAFYCEPRPLAQLKWNLRALGRLVLPALNRTTQTSNSSSGGSSRLALAGGVVGMNDADDEELVSGSWTDMAFKAPVQPPFFVTLTGTWRQWGDPARPHLDFERLKLSHWLTVNYVPCSMVLHSKDELPTMKALPKEHLDTAEVKFDPATATAALNKGAEGGEDEKSHLLSQWYQVVESGSPQWRGLLAHMQALHVFDPTPPSPVSAEAANSPPPRGPTCPTYGGLLGGSQQMRVPTTLPQGVQLGVKVGTPIGASPSTLAE